MAKIKFVTDSAADIPQDKLQGLDILVIPFMIAYQDREFQDGVEYTNQEFYELLNKADTLPTHSQINPAIFQEVYTQVYEAGYDHLIYTSINGKGSSTCQNAVAAIDLFYEENPEAKGKFSITVLDSKIYTYVYGHAVVTGAQMAKEGKSVEEIVAWMQDWIDHVTETFAPYTLKFAKKSGRVSAAAAFLGEALGLKPLMRYVNGESTVLNKVRGDKAVNPAMVKLAVEEMEPGSPYLLIWGSNEERNLELKKLMEEAVGYPSTTDFYIGGVIAINAGPAVTGVVYRKK